MKSISISKLIHFFFLIAILLPVTFAYAGKIVTIEGTLKGAGCVHFKQECSNDDAHIAMEKDFVLLLPDGQHYGGCPLRH